MDLQDIKKEIDSLNFDNKKSDEKNVNEFTFMGFNKIKLGLIGIFSFLFVYVLKPSFILNIYYDPSKNDIVKKVKWGKYFLSSLVAYVILLFVIRRMFC